jgi:hypothetical protein
MTSSRLSHLVIKSLYEVLDWYFTNPGAGQAPLIINYYELWKSLHMFSVNISPEGWEALRNIASNMGLQLRPKEGEWAFLFAVEAYLHMLVRVITLSKLGRAPRDIITMQQNINNLRNIFEHSLFEWVFAASSDQGLPQGLRNDLKSNADTLILVAYYLDLAAVSFDAFREMYQNVVPKEVRRSLGEFYTEESVVDDVLDAAGLDKSVINDLYEKWGTGDRKPVVLDPACGSGSFLVRVIRRFFASLDFKPDIADFIEDVIVGIDINPFAVEMAKLNIMLVLSEELKRAPQQANYVPRHIRVYWADSLATFRIKNTLNQQVVSIGIPSLSRVIERETFEVPDPSVFIPIEKLVNVARSCVNDRDFIIKLSNFVDPRLVNNYANVLKDFYSVIEKIHQSGNDRLVELIKESLVVEDLIAKCDYVIGNPPWVRTRALDDSVRRALKNNYKYFKRDSPYNPAFKKTKVPFKEQHDYSVAFVERGLELLREGGVLSYVITSKIVRSSYAGKMREDLLTNYKILELIDYSLHPRRLFQDATNYPLILAVKKEVPQNQHKAEVIIVNTRAKRRSISIPQYSLSLNVNDKKSPWILAPPNVITALHKLVSMTVRLGDVYEIHRGVMTSKDELYFINNIHSYSGGVAYVELADGEKIHVEEGIVQVLVRGRDIDAYSYSTKQFIIFPHDTTNYDPLWDSDQKAILQMLGLLSRSRDLKVRSSGQFLIYEFKDGRACNGLLRKIQNVASRGGKISQKIPCSVDYCYDIAYGNSNLEVRIESTHGTCRVYVYGLKIPNTPCATRHFMGHLNELINRDDYNATLPPWAIFRVNAEKFKDYRIAWQEMAKYIEACALPLNITINIGGVGRQKLIVPPQTVYFIIEEDLARALKLLLYFNSRLARNIVKLWAWSARGGTYRHDAFVMGHLPIPDEQLLSDLWKQHVRCNSKNNVNEAAMSITDLAGRKLEQELLTSLGLSEEDYKAIVEYGEWLNEGT